MAKYILDMLAISDFGLMLLQAPAQPIFGERSSMDPAMIRTTHFYFYCALCLLLFLVRTLFAKDWTSLFEAFRSEALAKTSHLQDQFPITIGWAVLLVVSSAVFAILYVGYAVPDEFFTKTRLLYKGDLEPSYLFLLAYWTGLIFLAIIIRLLWLSLFTLILPVRKEVGLYIKTVAMYTIFLGIALLPIAFIQSFSPDIPRQWILWVVVAIYAVFVILRVFRGFSIAKPYLSIRIDYIIAYFCALEILPVVLLLKVSGFFNHW